MILDIIIIAIIALFTFKCFSRGLTRSIFMSISGIVSMFASFILAKRYAIIFNKAIVTPFFGEMIEEIVHNNVNLHDILASISAENLSLYTLALNISQEDVSNLLALKTSEALTYLESHLISALSLGISFIMIFIISGILVSIAFKILLKLLDFVLKVTLLKPIDKILGGILGLVTSCIIIYFVVWGLYSVVPVGLFSENTINSHTVNFVLQYKLDTFITFIK